MGLKAKSFALDKNVSSESREDTLKSVYPQRTIPGTFQTCLLSNGSVVSKRNNFKLFSPLGHTLILSCSGDLQGTKNKINTNLVKNWSCVAQIIQ